MKRTPFSRRAVLAGVASLAFTAAPRAQAQTTVIDPTNLAQNVIQAARALEQITNQIRQIEQQASMLARSPLQLSGELGRSLEAARGLFEAAQGVAFEADEVAQSLRDLYPETFDAFDLNGVLQRSGAWLEASRDSLERAMRAEAQAAGAVRETRGRVAAALSASADAEGQTGAAQAGNQLLGVTATELAEIQALLAAQGRALAIERMERIARQQRAGEIRRRAFPTTRRLLDPARSAF